VNASGQFGYVADTKVTSGQHNFSRYLPQSEKKYFPSNSLRTHHTEKSLR